MRSVLVWCSFIGVLAVGREHAAVYAHGVGITQVGQFILAIIYYALFIAVIWLGSTAIKKHVIWRPELPVTRRVLRQVKHQVVDRVHRPDKPERDVTGHAAKPLWRLLPLLLIYAMVPNGFWLGVRTLRQRETNVYWAIAWLAPCNALSYKVYFALLGLVDVAGLGWVFPTLAKIVIGAGACVAALLMIDLLYAFSRYLARFVPAPAR